MPKKQTETQESPAKASDKVVFLPDLPSTATFQDEPFSALTNTPPQSIHVFPPWYSVLFTNLAAKHIIHRKKTPQERGGQAGVEALGTQPTINLILHITNHAQLGGVIRTAAAGLFVLSIYHRMVSSS